MKKHTSDKFSTAIERATLIVLMTLTCNIILLEANGDNSKDDSLMNANSSLLTAIASSVDSPPVNKDEFSTWRDNLVIDLNARNKPGPAVLAIMSYIRDTKNEKSFFLLLPVLDALAKDMDPVDLMVTMESFLRKTKKEDIDSRSLVNLLIRKKFEYEQEHETTVKYDTDSIESALDKAEDLAGFPYEVAYLIFTKAPSQFYVSYADKFYANDLTQRRKARWLAHLVETIRWRNQHGFNEKISNTDLTEADEILAHLAATEQWWARAYVAQIMVELPKLRELDVIKRLKQDQHPLVTALANQTLAQK